MQSSFVLCLLLIATSLSFWGAKEVRGNFGEVFLLTMWGAGWLIVSALLIPWLGLDAREDVAERKNPAALVALTCAQLSVAIVYTGGSLGEGPSYWENIFSAGLAMIAWFALWMLMELAGKISISIAEERDLASGLRFGGWLLACGVILARAVAGDWHSTRGTMQDFARDGWPAAALFPIAMVAELLLRPSRLRPFPAWIHCGLIPAVIYLTAAGFWLAHLGWWEGKP